ncbi:MAG: 2-amino-4-hydroxy-6-hydroxymethyldihydropteridine diphosphokinase [Myxococcota bacterium]
MDPTYPWNYIGLGTNLGDRVGNITTALDHLKQRLELSTIELSYLYATEPRMDLEQPTFINAVARFAMEIDPFELLRYTMAIEEQMGRQRDPNRPKGPRIIDLDLLSVGSQRVQTAELTLPHPGIPMRRFVLCPWADLDPEWRHPQTGQTIRQMLALTPDRGEVELWTP